MWVRVPLRPLWWFWCKNLRGYTLMNARKFPPCRPRSRTSGKHLSVTRGCAHYHSDKQGIRDALQAEIGVISTYRDALMRLRLFVKRRVFVDTFYYHSADTQRTPSTITQRTPKVHSQSHKRKGTPSLTCNVPCAVLPASLCLLTN